MLIFALKKGDSVVREISAFISEKKIKSGLVIGLGALEEATLMLYDLRTKEYLTKRIEGPLEVGSLTAIIGKDPQGKPHIHPHVVVANKEFTTFCGHLKEGIVSATLELTILKSDQEVERYADSDIGLNLIK